MHVRVRRFGLDVIAICMLLPVPRTVPPAQAGIATPRPYTVDDLLRVERIAEVVPAPDGSAFAIVRCRGRIDTRVHMRDFMDGLDRADVWLADSSGRPARNLTHGVSDGSGWFLPAWSPDGRILAMLSTRGQRIRVWVWDRRAGTLREASTRELDIIRPVWQSPTRLLCVGVADGRQASRFIMETTAPTTAMKRWPEAWAGQKPTASVLSSGATSVVADNARDGTLWAVNLRQATTTAIARGAIASVACSPDGRRLAYLVAEPPAPPDPNRPIPNRATTVYRLETVGGQLPPVRHVQSESLRWSGGGVLAVRVSPPDGESQWIRPGGPVLGAGMGVPITNLVTWPGQPAYLAVADGALWRVPDDGSAATRLRIAGTPVRVTGIDNTDGLVAFVKIPGGTARVVFETGELVRITPPVPEAEVRGVAIRTGLMASVDRSETTTSVFVGSHVVMTLNAHLDAVARASLVKIAYRSQSGQPLTGWLLRPAGVSDHEPLPTVVWVYGGLVHPSTPPPYWVRLDETDPLALQLWCARGYAVLLPSMPAGTPGSADGPMSTLVDGVMPAIDTAVQIGLVDPARLVIAGHSFGGYSVLGLVAQSQRFRAAIALGAPSNLTSLYGALDARWRYADGARDRLLFMMQLESGQYGMGLPPWRDAARYAANSPITHVESVTTPVLIAQGDLDYVPIQQGEEFFTALYRMGKPAAFVRYWGEGHILESPANIRDLWERMAGWVTSHLHE